MADVLIKHTVQDFEAWKSAFDEHASTRMEYGSQGYRLFTVADDPNEVVVLFEWDDAENARRFLEESGLREVMDEAGVVGDPEIYFLDEMEAKSPEPSMA
ncbi:antibiotic biosynthesis monooxygenase [Halobacteriaceae archaeon GCM10025711]